MGQAGIDPTACCLQAKRTNQLSHDADVFRNMSYYLIAHILRRLVSAIIYPVIWEEKGMDYARLQCAPCAWVSARNIGYLSASSRRLKINCKSCICHDNDVTLIIHMNLQATFG